MPKWTLQMWLPQEGDLPYRGWSQNPGIDTCTGMLPCLFACLILSYEALVESQLCGEFQLKPAENLSVIDIFDKISSGDVPRLDKNWFLGY